MHSGNERINDVFKAKAAITIAVNEYREIFFYYALAFPTWQLQKMLNS